MRSNLEILTIEMNFDRTEVAFAHDDVSAAGNSTERACVLPDWR